MSHNPLEQRLMFEPGTRGYDYLIYAVGAGPLGLEIAAEFAEAGRIVTLVCGGVRP